MRTGILVFAVALAWALPEARAIDPQSAPSVQSPAPAPDTAQTRQEVSRRAPSSTPVPIQGTWLLTSNDTYASFADQSQVTVLANGRRRMWVTGVNRQPLNDVKYTVALQEYDCVGREYRTVSGSYYDLTDHVVASITPIEFSPVIPHSVADGALTLACANPAQWGNSGLGAVLIPNGFTAVAYADRVVFATLPINTNLMGVWGAGGNCENALVLRTDGTFSMTALKRDGRWSLGTNSLHLVHNDGTSEDAPINWTDANNFRLSTTTGAPVPFRRC